MEGRKLLRMTFRDKKDKKDACVSRIKGTVERVLVDFRKLAVLIFFGFSNAFDCFMFHWPRICNRFARISVRLHPFGVKKNK